LYSVFLFAPLWFPLNFPGKWSCSSKSSSAAWLLNLADLTEGQISYQVQQLCITCLFNLQNSRAAAAATVYLVYMLEVSDNLCEQFGVLFMYLVSHSCFVLLLGQATLQKVSPILLRRSVEWKCQECCSVFNLHLWTADYGLYKPSFSLWFEIWGRKFWNLKRTHHEALQLERSSCICKHSKSCIGTHPKAGKLLVKFSTDFLLILKKDLDIVKESSKYTQRRCCYHWDQS
jgi:hypothetical protein